MKSLQLDKPHAIIVIGIQGSGKTFFAEKFASTFKAPYIEQALFNDSARDMAAAKHLFDSVLTQTLKAGKSIVLELAFSSRAERADITRTLIKAGYVPMYVWVQVDVETAITRSRKTSGVSEQEYRDESKRFSAPLQSEKALVISGKHTFATQAKAVLKKFSTPRPPQQSVERPQAQSQPQPQSQRGQIVVR